MLINATHVTRFYIAVFNRFRAVFYFLGNLKSVGTEPERVGEL